MIKVCHMTSAHAPHDTRIFYKECVSLARAGYEVYLVQRGESSEELGVHVIGVGQPSGGRLSRMTSFSKKVYETALALDADIYHFHDPELLPYGLKLKKRGKKVIFDSHEFYSTQLRQKPYLPRWCTRLIARGYTVYERHALRRLDGVIFPCTINGKNPFIGRCARVATVDNSVNLESYYQHYDPQAKKKNGLVCYVGSLSHERGVTANIQAAYQTGCTLALAGKFNSHAYEESLRSMPEFSCVDYRGFLSKQEILSLLQESQVGLCTLLNRGQYWMGENLPTKIGEYLSMGLPVVCNASPFNQAVVEHYHCGICVDPENLEEVAGAIRYLLDHPEEARKMGENGRRAVKEKFNWGIEEKKLLALYTDILAEAETDYK